MKVPHNKREHFAMLAQCAVKMRSDADDAAGRSEEVTRCAVNLGRKAGFSTREIASAIGISHQRVSQIARGK